MFGRKTVESVIDKLQYIVDELEELVYAKNAESTRQQTLEFAASVASREALGEAERANRVAGKLKELLS